jgi:hypothetical protein
LGVHAPARNPVTTDAIVTDHRAELCDKLRVFQEIFRIERGAQLLLSGESMEVVLMDEVARLQRLVLLRDAQVAEMRERLWAMDEP